MRAQLFNCWYSSTQARDDVRRLFDAACESARLTADPIDSRLEPRSTAIALALSREWGMADLEARIVPAVEAQFEPTWDRALGEFTWGLGLEEEHPRGQFNAFLAAAEAVSSGAWTRLSAAPLAQCPQVIGLDFPNVALSQAHWNDEILHLSLVVHRAEPSVTTSFRVVGAELERTWRVTGKEGSSIQPVDGALLVTIAQVSGDLKIMPVE